MTKPLCSMAEERITKNLEQTGRLFNEIVENPDILDEIPDGAMVFLLPKDDPELAEQSREGARRARQAGHTVHLRSLSSAAHTPNHARAGWLEPGAQAYNDHVMERPE